MDETLFDFFEQNGFDLLIIGTDEVHNHTIEFTSSATQRQMLDLCEKYGVIGLQCSGGVDFLLGLYRHRVQTYGESLSDMLSKKDFTTQVRRRDGSCVIFCDSVLFTGSAREKIEKNPVTILRWFELGGCDPETMKTVGECSHLLKLVDKDLVWDAMKKLLIEHDTLLNMQSCGVLKALGMDCQVMRVVSKNPLVILGAICRNIPEWNLSLHEVNTIEFVRHRYLQGYSLNDAMLDMQNGIERLLLVDVLLLCGRNPLLLPVRRVVDCGLVSTF